MPVAGGFTSSIFSGVGSRGLEEASGRPGAEPPERGEGPAEIPDVEGLTAKALGNLVKIIREQETVQISSIYYLKNISTVSSFLLSLCIRKEITYVSPFALKAKRKKMKGSGFRHRTATDMPM